MTVSADFWKPRQVPTMYFIGVTTGKSSIMKVFPRWSTILGLGAQIEGYDAPIHGPVEVYQQIIRHIKGDPLSLGALVTTHKIDLLNAARDLFDYLDPHAQRCGEVSSISKCNGRLEGHAIDPISSGLAWEAFVTPGYWGRTGASVLCLGAGGSAVAISTYLVARPDPADRPRKFIVVNRSQGRLDSLRRIHAQLNTDIEFEYIHNQDPLTNDKIMTALPPGSIVINATGMGKDTPGSPITDAGLFPENGVAWELNYRGELDFMRQAERQSISRGVRVEDGWVYFVHGWTQVVAKVFHLDLTPAVFAQLERAAASMRV